MPCVIAAATCRAEELAGIQSRPDWRKATRGMILASVSMERALSRVDLVSESMALIVGSVAGELETTADFLMTFAKERLARPLLFQNSLHNATAGFASIGLKLTGPSFTISSGADTAVESFDLAGCLLRESLCDFCLVTLVEVNARMTELLHLPSIREGACTLLLTSEEQARASGLRALWTPSESDLASLRYNIPAEQAPLIDLPASTIWRLEAEWNRKV